MDGTLCGTELLVVKHMILVGWIDAVFCSLFSNIYVHKKKLREKNHPWRSHFCIRGENLPEDDDEPVDFTYMDVIACALIKRLFCTVIILEE